MQETPRETDGPAPIVPRFRQTRQSVWPLTIGAVLLILIGVAAVLSLLRRKELDEPWRIDYPGVTVLGGEDEYHEGQRRLRIAVRFEKDVVSTPDVERYLATLVGKTKNVYAYYHIKVLNRRLVHVIDAVADRGERYSVTPTEDYYRQGAGAEVDTGDASPSVIARPGGDAPRQPWEFDHPGVAWLSGKVDVTEEGRRHLRVTIRFEKPVVFTHDLEAFLDAFLAREKRAYPYYHVKAFNAQGAHVLDAVADDEGNRRILPTEHYGDQKPPDAPDAEIRVD